MSDAWFDDVAAVLDDAAVDEDAAPVSDTMSETDEPDLSLDATPDPEPETLVAEAEAETPEADTTPTAEPELAPEPQPQAVNWDDPSNPYLTQAQQHAEKAGKYDQSQAVLQALMQRRAEQLAAERMLELSDHDQQKATELQAFIQQQQQPLTQQMQTLNDEIEVVSKAATVYDAAVRLFVSPDVQAKIDAEVERLMRLPGGYSVLQNHLETRQQVAAEKDAEVSTLQKENERLRKQLLAKAEIAERQASGADLVESGTGMTSTFGAKWDAATGDAAIDLILADLPTG